MSNFQYLLVLGACVLATLPLECAGARVYRRPRSLVRAVFPVAVIFGLWDVMAISADVWAYNPTLISGIRLPGHIPVEEVLFFLIVPVCGVLTYESVQAIARKIQERRPPQMRKGQVLR